MRWGERGGWRREICHRVTEGTEKRKKREPNAETRSAQRSAE